MEAAAREADWLVSPTSWESNFNKRTHTQWDTAAPIQRKLFKYNSEFSQTQNLFYEFLIQSHGEMTDVFSSVKH